MNMMHMGAPMNGGPPPPQMLQMHHPLPHHVAVFAHGSSSQNSQAPPLQAASATPPVPSSMNRSQRASCPQSTREMSSHRSTTSRRCGVCRGCQCKPCGQCTYCQDSPQFGGPGVKKQSCIERRCLRVLENRLQRDAPTFKARVGCNACEDCRMQDCQICLVCLDKRFFENRHIPGAMCAKKRCNNAQSIECVPSLMSQNPADFVQRAPKRSYELINPVISQQQQQQQSQMHFDVKRVQYMTGPPPQMMQQMQMQAPPQQQIPQPQTPQQQVQQHQQRPNSNSSHSQGPSPPRNGVSQQQQQQTPPQQQNGVAHQIKTDVNVENLEQHQQQQQQQQQQLQQQQQRMIFQPAPYPDLSVHARLMVQAPPQVITAPAPIPLPQGQMTHMPQHGLDIPYLIPTSFVQAVQGQADPFYPSKFELDFEHNGDPFVPPSYAQDMKGQVVLQQL
ncbi:CXXC-type domain-containing protein [Caenorhabditis elegans]|uniref:CXXC-type domain-containing protein n=1 Tax=Caenorhabditis elegans TaxID=6239 RepID=A0A168H3A5_CAEEL|nr:CXXC-type domain-containing protein [Caenorhabditis elegans]SAP35547.1 CXXC-type domain-containing protein [Caenorhabditis elegans]|eukprot:NP_001317790.1 Uncharacterized protein CELE_Y75B8A.6 [Caenorhabditis elegans]